MTDYEGGVIWRVPEGGGAAREWLRAPALDGGPFGSTGIVLAADRRTFVIGQQSEAGLGAGNPATGRLLTVERRPDGSPGPVRQLWESRPFDGPDGFAIAASGAIYVASLLSDQLVVIGPDGTERGRFPSTPLTGADGSAVPFDAPSSVRFLGTRLMVANQAYATGDPSHQAILDVEAGEPGLAEYVPPKPTARPKPKKRHHRTRHRHRHRHR